MSGELDLTIDENNLLGEWQGQAALMLDYGVKLADAMQEEDETRAELTLVAAELDKAIRAEPELFGITKATESGIANTIIVQSKHIIATERVNDAKHSVRVLKAAVDALSHRKSALQGMTDLFLRQWYADPTSSDQPAELRTAAGPPSKVIQRRVRRTTSSN